MHWTSDGYAYLYQGIYSCRIAVQFTSNFLSYAELKRYNDLPKHTKAILGPWSFWPVISVPSFVVLAQIRMTFRLTPLKSLRPRLRSFGPLDFSAVFFFKQSKVLLASTVIFFEDTSLNLYISQPLIRMHSYLSHGYLGDRGSMSWFTGQNLEEVKLFNLNVWR